VVELEVLGQLDDLRGWASDADLLQHCTIARATSSPFAIDALVVMKSIFTGLLGE